MSDPELIRNHFVLNNCSSEAMKYRTERDKKIWHFVELVYSRGSEILNFKDDGEYVEFEIKV